MIGETQTDIPTRYTNIVDGVQRKHVYLQSVDHRKAVCRFWVYTSNSELGMWRVCILDDDRKYEKGIDYVQSTLVHLELQQFLNSQRLDRFKSIGPNIVCTFTINPQKHLTTINDYKLTSDDIANNNDRYKAIYNVIYDKSRVLKENPFFSFHRSTPCGTSHDAEQLSKFSSEVKHLFSARIDERYNTLYTSVFNEMTLSGNIRRFRLTSKTVFRPPLQLHLYFYHVTSVVNNRLMLTSIVDFICRPGIAKCVASVPFVMPILLAPVDVVCNCYGMYTQYIPAGMFVCKAFDYNKQCTYAEIASGSCDWNYSFVGHRYRIFPYDSLDLGNAKSRGRSRSRSRSKSRSPESLPQTRRHSRSRSRDM